MKRHIRLNVFLCMILLSLVCCKQKTDFNAVAHSVHLDPYMKKKLEAEMFARRKEKDEYFRTSSDSPLPVEIRPIFTGLEYYPLDWKYRFEGPVHPYPEQKKFKMITTSGELRDAVRYGFLRFDLDGRELRLEVYRLLDMEEKNLLFIPFVDANVGKETYSAGRYIDLVERPNGLYVIDFNAAYNPSCAYGGSFPCPVTPAENHLSVSVPAGEKILPIAEKLEKADKKRASGVS